MAKHYTIDVVKNDGSTARVYEDYALKATVTEKDVDLGKPVITVDNFPDIIEYGKGFSMSGTYDDSIDFSSGIKDIKLWINQATTPYAILTDMDNGVWQIDNIKFVKVGQKAMKLVITDNAGNSSETTVVITAIAPRVLSLIEIGVTGTVVDELVNCQVTDTLNVTGKALNNDNTPRPGQKLFVVTSMINPTGPQQSEELMTDANGIVRTTRKFANPGMYEVDIADTA